MKKMFPLLTGMVLCAVVLGVGAAAAKDKMQGTIMSENSVSCGSEAKGKNKKETVTLMCQEYVIRTGTTDYHVRQEKEAHKAMLPVNAPAELSLSKDKMKFTVNGKSYEMLIVSESAAPTTATAPAAASAAAPAAKP
jgi:hypothetical protein